MATRDKIQINYNRAITYTNTQDNYVGAQDDAGKRGSLPTFTDANTRHVEKTGSDANAGTAAAPYLTVQKALDNLGGAFLYALIQDSGTYRERPDISYAGTAAGGLYAKDGEAPTIEWARGAIFGTYGSRRLGRTKFSAGAYPGTFYFVSKAGNDGTGTRGNPALPFLTIQAALNDGSRVNNDTVQIDDDGVYEENLTMGGALNVTIQAKDTFIPTIKQQTGSRDMIGGFTNPITMNIYGINLVGQVVDPHTQYFLIFYNQTGTVSLWDCSLSNAQYAVDCTIEDHTLELVNCYLEKQNLSSVLSNKPASFTASNCHFEKNGWWFDSSMAATDRVLDLRGRTTGVDWGDMTIENCTFNDPRLTDCIYISGAMAAPTDGDVVIRNCDFIGHLENPTTTAAIHLTGSSVGDTCTIENIYAYRLTGAMIVSDSHATDFTADTLVAENCGRNFAGAGGQAEFNCNTKDFTMKNCVVTKSKGASAFRLATVGVGTQNYEGISIVGSDGDGMLIDTTVGTPTTVIKGVAQQGAGAGKFGVKETGGNGTVNLWYSVLEAGTTGAVLANSLVATKDPQFIDTTDGSYNVALDAESLGAQSGPDLQNVGMKGYTLQVSAANYDFSIDGIKFAGAQNMSDGVHVDLSITNVTVAIRYCTFEGLGVQCVKGSHATEVKYCDFAANGFGVSFPEFNGKVWYSVGRNCKSAFIILGGTGTEVQNNSAQGCDYGQFDKSEAVPGVIKNNVYSGSGTADYFGRGQQLYSCIPILGGQATVDANSTRQDPLFRDVAGNYVGDVPDLRIQSIAEGFYFDSPCLLQGDDSKDMGAYQFTYDGSPVTVWVLVDFATTDYRNPDHLDRFVMPLKLAEGDTHGGGTYSTAAAFKTEYVLRWDPNNAMIAAQVADLVAIYTTGNGRCQISFDGGATFIDVQVIRSGEFLYTEIEESFYTNDSLPTPVNELRFREIP